MTFWKRCLLFVGTAFLLALLYGLHVGFRVVIEPSNPIETVAMVTGFYTLVFTILGAIGYGFYRLHRYAKPWLRPFVSMFALSLALATAFIGMLVMTNGLLREEEYQLGYILMLIASWTVAAFGVLGLMAVPFAAGIYYEARKKAAAKR